ncbi:MAG: S24 family peptidase [Pseudomonadota bacterium]
MQFVRVRGDSMSPSYRDGDYVLALKYGRRMPKAGDDIVYRHPERGLLLKRVEQVDDRELQVGGLNSLSAESSALGPVHADEFSRLSRVVFHIPRS